MRCASIDIGTNTVLLLVVEVESGIRQILDISESPRLGQNLSRSGKLDEEAIERTISVLKRYLKILRRERVERVFPFGTQALREAQNSDQFIRRVEEELGLKIEILSEKKEAYYSLLSVITDDRIKYDSEVIVDIGGGSTEIIYEGNLKEAVSVPFGAVKLKETFLFSDPPLYGELMSLRTFVDEELKRRLNKRKKNIIGLGGTVSTIGAIHSGREFFDRDIIHGRRIKKDEVSSLLKRMEGMSQKMIRETFLACDEKRADIILCGVLLLERIMDFFDSDYVVVSTRGARYGIILEKVKEAQGALKDHPLRKTLL